MNLSRSSWHYKLNCCAMPGFYGQPKSLCAYFWMTVASVLITAGFILMGLLFLTVGVIVLPYPLYEAIWGVSWGHWAIICYLIFWMVLAHIAWESRTYIFQRAYWLHKPLFIVPTIKPRVKVRRRKPPSLFSLWWKAKKEKICPLVQFSDQE